MFEKRYTFCKSSKIAEQIRDAVSSNYGAVGKEDFSKAFLQINEKM